MARDDLTPLEKKVIKRMSDRKRVYSIEELCDQFGCTPSALKAAAKTASKHGVFGALRSDQGIIEEFEEDLLRKVSRKRSARIDVDAYYGNELRFGAVGDTHMGSPHYVGDARVRGGPLWDFYRFCADQGITQVFHSGNWIDGHASFNQFSNTDIGATAQVEKFLNEYPAVPGVRTAFIAGDDHEGWWWQKTGLDIADFAASKALMGGRDDMDFIGYLEGDVAIVPGEGFRYNKYKRDPEAIKSFNEWMKGEREFDDIVRSKGIDLEGATTYALMKVLHAGGGTANAKSLQPQRIISTYDSMEKPQIVLIGHYHKQSYDFVRNTHMFQVGTSEEQSPFMRKKNLRAELGGWVIGINQDETGAINRIKHRFIAYVGGKPNFNLRDYTMHDGR